MSNVDISVVIPVFNAELLINRCLDSISKQRGNFKIEIIVVDDGSQDHTEEIIKQRKEKIIFYKQQNSGPAVARNKGVELSSGRYIAYLDGDDYWKEDFLYQTYTFLERHQECVGVTVGQEHHIYGSDKALIVPSFITHEESQAVILGDFFEFWAKYNHVCTGSALLRSEYVKKTGGQRVDMRICEDTEFWLLMATYGKMGFIPQVLFISDGGAITVQQGWHKYIRRFHNIPEFDVWFSRLSKRLTTVQLYTIREQLNGIVCGISRAKISGGDYRGAYHNLKYLFPTESYPLLVKVYKCGKMVWYPFALCYQLYQYLKINQGVIRHKLHLK